MGPRATRLSTFSISVSVIIFSHHRDPWVGVYR